MSEKETPAVVVLRAIAEVAGSPGITVEDRLTVIRILLSALTE